MEHSKFLNTAIVQTTLDCRVAWNNSSHKDLKMDSSEASKVWKEILRTFDNYINCEDSEKPDLILLPELCVAKCYEKDIIKLANQTGCIIISGLDFNVHGKKVENQALVSIPYNWPHGNGTSISKSFYFGKYIPAKAEEILIKSCGKEFVPCDNIYILNAEQYGRIGLAICADFYDIERFALYKGRIQHLFILAYNKDIKSFLFLAEAISRLVYCNVVICNTGHYGGSICFSLKNKDYQRYIYRHEGAELFTSQIVKLPVESFFDAQTFAGKNTDYKNPPPRYEYKYDEDKRNENGKK